MPKARNVQVAKAAIEGQKCQPSGPPRLKAAIYARVSTTDQDCSVQLGELRAYCARRDWAVQAEYVDTITGKAASRPSLNRLFDDAREHRFDVVVVWKIDRFGRSVKNFTEHVARLDAWGIRFLATTQNIDTDKADPMSRLLMHMLSAFAEFEREMIVERVKAGIHAAKLRGVRFGQPRVVVDRADIVAMSKYGYSSRAIGKKHGISYMTVQRIVKAWCPRCDVMHTTESPCRAA
jgi:putative DNA-invertase from lambdoid prophage Rac